MSYDLEALHAKSGIRIASLVFASGTDLAGTSFIASQLNGIAIIHQIAFQASGLATIQIGRATAAASGYWYALGNINTLVEQCRIPIDQGSGAYLSGTNGIGNGFIRAYYTVQPGLGVSVGSL